MNTQNLSSIDPAVNNVGFWNELSLYYENGKLYLVMVAFVYDSNNIPVTSKNNIYIFSTTPTGEASNWQWVYSGQLSGAAEAGELGAQMLTQVEIAKGTDGKLLLISSPTDWSNTEKDFNHKGCNVIEIKSLEVVHWKEIARVN